MESPQITLMKDDEWGFTSISGNLHLLDLVGWLEIERMILLWLNHLKHIWGLSKTFVFCQWSRLVLAGDDLADWCLQIYRDFKEEHQDELKEEARAGRESQMQQIHLKFPIAPELKALSSAKGGSVPCRWGCFIVGFTWFTSQKWDLLSTIKCHSNGTVWG